MTEMRIDAAIRAAAELERLRASRWFDSWLAFDRLSGEVVDGQLGGPRPEERPDRTVLQVPRVGSRPVTGANVLRADRNQHAEGG